MDLFDHRNRLEDFLGWGVLGDLGQDGFVVMQHLGVLSEKLLGHFVVVDFVNFFQRKSA